MFEVTESIMMLVMKSVGLFDSVCLSIHFRWCVKFHDFL